MAPKRRRVRIPKAKQDFFGNIPQEIMIEILSRLLIPTVMRCKRVCKSWLGLIESLEFANSHFSKSVRGLALDEDRPLTLALYRGEKSSKPYKILELVDSEDSGHHCNVVFKFNFPHRDLVVHSSADGLLLLLQNYGRMRDLFICNPITREYIKLPPLSRPSSSIHQYNAFGIGVSKLTGKYKVVRMFQDNVDHLTDSRVLAPPKCEVYTLGTGSWRSVAASGPFWYSEDSCVFFNGNLHWLVYGLFWEDIDERISYFDLETECLSTFSIPDHGYQYSPVARNLCALGDSLCLCHHARDYVIDIWLMNKYGDDKSWTKVCVIRGSFDKLLGPLVVPIQRFNNGDILLADQFCPKLYCYLSKTHTIREVDLTKRFARDGIRPSIYTPSFLPLKTFAMENVSSF